MFKWNIMLPDQRLGVSTCPSVVQLTQVPPFFHLSLDPGPHILDNISFILLTFSATLLPFSMFFWHYGTKSMSDLISMGPAFCGQFVVPNPFLIHN